MSHHLDWAAIESALERLVNPSPAAPPKRVEMDELDIDAAVWMPEEGATAPQEKRVTVELLRGMPWE